METKRILRCNPWNQGGVDPVPGASEAAAQQTGGRALMDQKRLFLAIAVSLAIMLGFQFLVAPHLPKPRPPPVAD